MRFLIFAVILCQIFQVRCGKILGIFPLPGESHYILGSAFMKELAERGHDVTVVSYFEENDIPAHWKYRHIVLSDVVAEFTANRGNFNMFKRANSNPFIDSVFMTYMMGTMPEKILKDRNLQALINSGEKFDVLVLEQFLNDGFKLLAPHFEANLVLMNMVRPELWSNFVVGNPGPTSYIPDIFLSYSSHMTFWQRLTNSVLSLFKYLILNAYFLRKHNNVMKEFLPNSPDIGEVMHNASIILVNSHPSLSQPVPTVPNMIEIGGFHIKPPKPLPTDLQKFFDESTEGVIYFSLGSNLQSTAMSEEKREIFIKAFSKLKLKVLWKWENDTLPNKPDNVVTGKWLPQRDLLAHSNVKLFITHGGFTSTVETTYHGVPILAIPVFGDQKLNAQVLVDNGVGLTLPYIELTQEKLDKYIDELLSNPKYLQNAKKMSSIFHDRLVSPMDTAVYWLEYVIRHGGAQHLRVAGINLPWYKYYLIDVIGFILASIYVSIYISKLLLKKTLKSICRCRSEGIKKAEKKKKEKKY